MVDRQILSRLSGDFSQTMARLEDEIATLAGEPFNLGSPKQLGEIPVSYTHLRAHETVLDIVCRLLLEKKRLEFHV